MLLADVCKSKNDYNGLIGSLERVLQIEPNNPEIMTTLADAYLKTRRYQPARDLFLSLTQLQPDDAAGFQNLGYCYLKLNGADGAIDAYNAAIDISSKDWQSRNALGAAYILKADEEDDPQLKLEAIRQWKLSLALKPDQPNRVSLRKLIEKYLEELQELEK
jgi:tetratricopeptide (TPR) repeat protein